MPSSDRNSGADTAVVPPPDAASDSDRIVTLPAVGLDFGSPSRQPSSVLAPASKPAPHGLGESPAAMDESPAALDGFSSPQSSALPLPNGHLAAIPALGPFDMFSTQPQQVRVSRPHLAQHARTYKGSGNSLFDTQMAGGRRPFLFEHNTTH
jgi:hypothetical protein